MAGRLVLEHQVHSGTGMGFVGDGLDALEGKLNDLDRLDTSTDPKSLNLSEAEFAAWVSQTVEAIEGSTRALLRFVPLQSIVLCSTAPSWLSTMLIEAVEGEKLNNVKVLASTAPNTDLLGSASLPITARFMVD